MAAQKAHDPRAVANLLLDLAQQKQIVVRHLKLQKLLYFAHGMHLITERRPLMSGNFEAWQRGPVHPAVYRAFREVGANPITIRAQRENVVTGEMSALPPVEDEAAIEAVRRVVAGLGQMSDFDLVDLSHAEGGPWSVVVHKMRDGFALGARIGDDVIRSCFARHKFVVRTDAAHVEGSGAAKLAEAALGIEKPFTAAHGTR